MRNAMVRPSSVLLFLSLAVTALIGASCGGGGGGGGRPAIDPGTSTVTVNPSFGAIADGTDVVTISATLVDTRGELARNRDVVIAVSGTSNTLVQTETTSDVNGEVSATLTTTIAEEKTVTVTTGTGDDEVVLTATPAIEFIWPSAQTFYVREGGDDTALGDSPNRAWATLGFAATQVVPGDTIFVGGGTYTESVSLTRSGAAGDEIFFIADRSGVFTGDSGRVIVDAAGADRGIDVNGASFVVLDGFAVLGATPGGGAGGGISIRNGADNVAVLNSSVYGNDRGIWVDGSSSVHLENLIASNNVGGDAVGVSAGDSSGLSIVNSRIYNNGSYGLHLRTSVAGLDLDVTTLYRNGDDQVREDGAGSTGSVRNSILSMGFADGLDFVAGTSLTQSNNAFDGNTGDAWVVGGVAQVLAGGSFEGDPLFLDPDGPDDLLGGADAVDDDFRVDPTSPTVDTGSVDASTIVLSFGGGALTGATTRSDGELDGTAPDGPLVNLGYHVPAPSDPLGGIDSGDGRLFFGRGNNVQVFGRSWNNDQTRWEPATLTDPAVATVKWVRNEVSPINSREELLAIFSDTGTETELAVQLWNGRFWTDAGGTDPIDSQILSTNADQRGFDIAYERLTGHAMVVYSDDTNNPVFRTFALGRWSDEASVFTTPPGTGEVLWVELASSGSSNEIALVALTADENLISIVWNGNAWRQDTATLLDTTVAVLTESQGFDVAFEQSSGDLLVAWGSAPTNEFLDYAVLPSGDTTFVFDVATSLDAVGGIVRLAPETGSDRIAIGVSEGVVSNSDAAAAIWDGTTVGDILEVELNTGAPDARDCAVSWVGQTGIAVFIWKGNDGGGALDWARFRASGWELQTDEPFVGIGDMEFIQANTFPTADQMMVLVSDDTGALYGMTYDTQTWAFTNSGQPLEDSLSDLGQSSQPFSFAFKP